MSKYYIKYKRKRLLSNFFQKTDVWELYGPVEHHFPDPITCWDETKIVISHLEDFTDEDEAYNITEKYREHENKNA